MEWNDNIYIKEFITDNRDGSENVQSLSVKVKAYKKDELPTVTGDGEILSYNDQSITVKTRSGKDYYDFDNTTPVLEKSFSYTVPTADRTSTSQDGNQSEYYSKYKQWRNTYSVSEECENCYNSLWTDLEALNISW